MGRKKISREKIIHAFLSSCFDKSAGGTSLSDVADSLEIKKASLYNHFKSREDMYNETIVFCGREVSAVGFIAEKTFDSINKNNILPVNLFKKLITRYFEFYENEPLLQMYAFLYTEQFYNDDVLEIVKRERKRLEDSIKKILDAFVDTKKFGEKSEKDLIECSICISSQILDKLQTYIVMRKSLVRKNPETGAGSLFSLPTDDFALNSSIKNVEFILKEFFE